MDPLLEALLRRPLTPAFRRETAYLLAGFGTALFGFILINLTGWMAGTFGITILLLPLAVPLVYANRWWCGIERSRAARVLRRPVPPRYTSPHGERRITRWISVLGDRQTWLDALWLMIGLPVGAIGLAVALGAWLGPLWLAAAIGYGWTSHLGVTGVDGLDAVLGPLLAVPAAVVGAWVVRAVTFGQASLAALLLGASRTEQLEQRVETLAETRAGAVDAAVSELQRVERDLHDGAQARLVALAMDLGMAEQRLAQADAQTALEHVAAARGQARAAMAELRDLVRGIGPSILNDRGLDAALTALVSGRNPPVELNVELSSTTVTAREVAAYFVVAEALANARKHAAASRILVNVWEDPARTLIVDVFDDGVGGADPGLGSGLSGLRKRVAALDGTLAVTSPPGGPTTIRAELPCG